MHYVIFTYGIIAAIDNKERQYRYVLLLDIPTNNVSAQY